MRALVQRVRSASVRIVDDDARTAGGCTTGEIVSEIGAGLMVLVGVTHDDDESDARELAGKVAELRILDGDRSASEVGAPLLVVSQFTLYADTRKGRRPSWHLAAPGPVAEPLVRAVVDHLRALGATVQTGRFGAHMAITLVADGPVTILMETRGRSTRRRDAGRPV